MKKIITFDKSLDFSKMIAEITSIELEHTLKFVDSSDIIGDFLVSGSYKMTEASQIEEKFSYKIPVDIALTEELELETAKIEIDDFYYEIENDDTMICHIDVKIEGVEHIEEVKEEPDDIKLEVREIEQDKKAEEAEPEVLVPIIEEVKEEIKKKVEPEKLLESICNRECDGDDSSQEDCEVEKEEDGKMEDNTIEDKEIEEVIDNNVGSLFSSLKDADETFATYSVYILRQEETIETVLNKYKITKEELEDYNDLSNLTVGAKIIIPTVNE